MGRLLLIRHGEGNRQRRYTPHPDIALTPTGRVQIEAAARWIGGRYTPRAIVSSPYARARQTADILSARLGASVDVEPDLRERHYGTFVGQPYDAPRLGYDPTVYWTWRPPGGESLLEVLGRAGAALDRLARTALLDEIIIVSHGAVMLALWHHVTGTWAEPRVVPNAGLIEVESRDGIYVAARRVGVDCGEREAWRR